MSASSYEPKYVEDADGDVPVPPDSPDPWTSEEKLKAIRKGENRLESDVNDGDVIPEDEREGIHGDAAAWFATFVLSLGPKAPGNMNAGQFRDEGSQAEEFHDNLLQQYKETVASILEAEGDASGGEGDENNDSREGNLRSSLI